MKKKTSGISCRLKLFKKIKYLRKKENKALNESVE